MKFAVALLLGAACAKNYVIPSDADACNPVDLWYSEAKEYNNLSDALDVLGYTESMWNNDQATPDENLDWDELSASHRQAWRTLGFNESSWNSCPSSGGNTMELA